MDELYGVKSYYPYLKLFNLGSTPAILAWSSSLRAFVLLAHTSANEYKHPNPLCGPKIDYHTHIVGHSPFQGACSWFRRSATHERIGAEEHSCGDDQDNELDKAGDVSAVS